MTENAPVSRGHAGVTSVSQIRAEESLSHTQTWREYTNTHTHTSAYGVGVCEAFNLERFEVGARFICDLGITGCPTAVTSAYFSICLAAR